MSADSRKPKITGGNWMKYCTVAKSMRRSRPIWTSVVVRARVACALRPVRSIEVAIFKPSRCAERCANDEFLTSFRATLMLLEVPLKMLYNTRCNAHFVAFMPIWGWSMGYDEIKIAKMLNVGCALIQYIFIAYHSCECAACIALCFPCWSNSLV